MQFTLNYTEMNVALDVTLNKPNTSGSNEFEVLVRALTGYQGTLLHQAKECTDNELTTEIIQDAITANELLCQLINDGFPEVFNLQFYRSRE